MKTKKGLRIFMLVFGLLLFTILASAGAVYAYWLGNVNNPANRTEQIEMNVGKGIDITDAQLEVTSVAKTDTSKVLVPSGKANLSQGTNNVEQYEFETTIKLLSPMSPGATGESKDIKLTKVSASFADDDTHGALVNVVITLASGVAVNHGLVPLNDNNGLKFKVVVTLTEPSTKQIYDAIQGKQIKIKLQAEMA